MKKSTEDLLKGEPQNFALTVQFFLGAAMSYDEITTRSDEVEHFFLKSKAARAIWHGAAYSKLQTKEAKKAYCDRYQLKSSTAQTWADNILQWGDLDKNPTLCITTCTADTAEKRLPFSAFTAATTLAKRDKSQADHILKQALEEKKPVAWVRDQCQEIQRQWKLTDTAERIQATSKKEGETISLKEAKKLAETNDRAARLKVAAKQKQKIVDKARKIVEEADAAEPVFKLKGRITALAAKQALKILYRYAAKTAHTDLAGGDDNSMTEVNLANETITKFLKLQV